MYKCYMFGVTYSKKLGFVGRFFFFFTIFYSYFLFSIQRAYCTLKQNLVKFKYTEVIY